MAVARTNIINFFSEEDFDKYFVLHKEFGSSLDECGLLEATYIRVNNLTTIFFCRSNRRWRSRDIQEGK